MNFGEYVHAARINRGLTLREFCRTAQIDPGNWSKTERGFQTPPKTRPVLEEVARTLGFKKGSDSWKTLFELATVCFIPSDLLDDAAIVKKLPVLFRTLRGEKPNKRELQKLIEKLRES